MKFAALALAALCGLLLRPTAAINLPIHYLKGINGDVGDGDTGVVRGVRAGTEEMNKRSIQALVPVRSARSQLISELQALLASKSGDEVLPYRFSFKGRK